MRVRFHATPRNIHIANSLELMSQAVIVPVINSGKCTRGKLDCDRLPRDPEVHPEPAQSKNIFAAGEGASAHLAFEQSPTRTLKSRLLPVL
jgi:hypothetical protein